MVGRRKKKEEAEKIPERGSHRRTSVSDSIKEGEVVAAPEGVEEVKTLEEPEEITMDVCEDWLNEAHTLLRNMIVRFNEGLTPLELDALGNGLRCVELVLSDEDMMVLYHNAAIEMAREARKEAEAKKRTQ